MAQKEQSREDGTCRSSTFESDEVAMLKRHPPLYSWVLYVALALAGCLGALVGWEVYDWASRAIALHAWIRWISLLLASSAWHALLTLSFVQLRRFDGALITKDEVLYASYCTSSVHALLACYGGYLCAFVDPAAMKALTVPIEAVYGTSHLRDYWLILTAGYLLFDLILALVCGSPFVDNNMILHHTVILVAFSVGILMQIGTFIYSVFLLNEFSTFFLNINWFMARIPARKSTVLYKLNGIVLCVSFFFARILLNVGILNFMLTRLWIPLHRVWYEETALPYQIALVFVSILAIAHAILNVFWFLYILKAAVRKLTRTSASKSKSS